MAKFSSSENNITNLHIVYPSEWIKLRKRAIIIISLVPEAREEKDEEIEKQIREDSFIPFCAEIEKVTIEEVENPCKELRKHGFSKKASQNIVEFHEG